MKLKLYIRWCLVGAGLAGSHYAAEPEKPVKFEPALIDSETTGDKKLGARFSLATERKVYSGKFDGVFSGVAKGTVMRRAEDNPENLSAEVEGIGRWLFDTPPGDPPAPGTPPPPPVVSLLPDRYLQLHGTLRFESDQGFDNTQLAIGPRVSFVALQNTGWWWIIPSVHIGYHRIEVFESEQLRKIGEPERSFYRFDAYAAWKWRPFARAQHAALVPIGLHADLRYYRAFEMPAAAERASLDDSIYRAFDVSYALSKVKYLREVYIRFARGRLPAAKTDAKTISLAVVIAP